MTKRQSNLLPGDLLKCVKDTRTAKWVAARAEKEIGEEMASKALLGKRYVNLLRCSTTMNEASAEDMKKVNDAYAREQGMTWVRDEVLEGVSGSKTFNRHDLKKLLEERKMFKKYDVILVYDSSRLARGGSNHSSSIRRDFAKAGVLIMSVMDPVPEGDFQGVMQAVIDTQNNLYAKKLSGFVTRGIVDNLKRGDVEHHGGLPIGIDRLYVRGNGKPFLRLRYLAHGVRQLMDEATGEVIRTMYPKIDRNTAYRKQADEKVWLTPGDGAVIEMIREAFTLRYRHGWGFIRISRHISQSGIAPLKAKTWCCESVRGILQNPMYLGWSYCLKVACGLFHMGDVERPRERKVNQEELEEQNREGIPQEKRPRSEMLRCEHPHLKNIITDPMVRERAETAINAMYDSFHVKTPWKIQNHNRHPESRFILKGLILEKKYNLHFFGKTVGRPGQRIRYYCLTRAGEFARAGGVAYRMVRAEQLEQAVFGFLRRLFSDTSRITNLVEKHVKRVAQEQPERLNRTKLAAEVKEIKSRLSGIFATAKGNEFAELSDLIAQLRQRRDDIERELSLVAVTDFVGDGKALAETVIKKLSAFDGSLTDPVCFEKLRLLVKRFVGTSRSTLKPLRASSR